MPPLLPKVENTCDTCGGQEIKKRIDDIAEIVEKRLKVYDEETSPLVEFYSQQGKLHSNTVVMRGLIGRG
jgi:adenylate kinase